MGKGDKKRGYTAGEPRKYASHQCYLNHRSATKMTHCRRGHPRINGRCPTCSAARIRAKKYGVSLNVALAIPDQCECCGDMVKLQMDHDHGTGEFRGWLCRPCNTVLGWVDDSPTQLEQLIQYINKER